MQRLLLLFASTLFALRGQNPAPKFEVASSFDVAAVRPGEPGVNGTYVLCESGRFTVYHDTLKALIQSAWRLRDVQVLGGPGWIESDEFYIAAKGDSTASADQCRAMVQALLADRFKLALHREMRQLPVYALVVDPKGPKFHESEASTRPDMTGGPGEMKAQRISTGILAQSLSRLLDRPVLDQTGLTGRYDFKLEWTPDGDAAGTGASIFAAVQEQLGLRLETKTGPMEVLVIDHVEKPSEN
jgi:uncharacterized protein (TIGR03435 family)